MKNKADKIMVFREGKTAMMTAALKAGITITALTTGTMIVISDRTGETETASAMNLTGVENLAEGRMNAKDMTAGAIFRHVGFRFKSYPPIFSGDFFIQRF